MLISVCTNYKKHYKYNASTKYTNSKLYNPSLLLPKCIHNSVHFHLFALSRLIDRQARSPRRSGAGHFGGGYILYRLVLKRAGMRSLAYPSLKTTDINYST